MRIIAGRFRGKTLLTPKSNAIRPTTDRVRESMFDILASRLGPVLTGQRVLDLFAGTGALGLEALSRGAEHVLFVETGIEGRGLIRDHIQQFGVAPQTRLLKRDATALGPLERFAPASLVFLDPPYAEGLGEKALQSAAEGGWIAPDATIVFEEKKGVEIAPPDGFAEDDIRTYGETSVHFLQYMPA